MDNCKICGKEMKLIPAGVSKKTGKAYNSFMACPDKCKSPINNTRPTQDFKFENMVMEEFAGLNKRLDGLAKFLKQNLGGEELV